MLLTFGNLVLLFRDLKKEVLPFIKYFRSDLPWDGKAVLLLYTELIVGFIRVLLYLAFVAIMVRIYTLPLFAFRPMYYTMR